VDAERARYYALFQEALAAPAELPGRGRGRGIVTCASQKFAPFVWILVRSLRFYGCDLPIELWHMAGEINGPFRRWLEPYGVTVRDAGALPWGRHRAFNGAHGFKPYAIVQSAFADVLFLDADNCALTDPTFVFDSPEFKDAGAIFWSDPVPMTAQLGAARLREDFGLAPGGAEFESGQLVVAKERCARALLATVHLNRYSGYYYRFLFGDKETFRLAFDATGQSYVLARQPEGAPRRDWRQWGHLQYWTDGRPLFQHRVGAKWEMLATRATNHDLGHLPPAFVAEIFRELQLDWPRIMPVGERLRPYAGIVRRVVQPWWLRPYFGWVRSSVRRVTERSRRA
jgi:alpha 1,2-mannosyltransferase